MLEAFVYRILYEIWIQIGILPTDDRTSVASYIDYTTLLSFYQGENYLACDFYCFTCRLNTVWKHPWPY